ncbi:hypothetical protein K2173_007400 [Erythroxylum novogranatense]|uniref:non-specific serine/threonine protein kinase n=1 Tax=Erythroxylum novogranatense TaxID=1862640 RepID=A0AAV8T7B8_9ROSI|nr:hypothetical protein K2173_007400 [Erythroxylum novogranatense]
MTESSGSSGGSSEVGIPSGLNRIRTSRVEQPSSRLEEFTESKTCGGLSRPPVKGRPKPNVMAQGRSVSASSKQDETRKGKKIPRWLTSYFSRDARQVVSDVTPNTEERSMETKTSEIREHVGSKFCNGNDNLNAKQSYFENVRRSKPSKCLKSFSHEIGPKGGIQTVQSRAHSYSDLEELLGSLRARFDAAKEVVNAELASFAGEVIDVLENIDASLEEEQKMAEDLLILAHICMKMTCVRFRSKCEIIVQDLTEKRSQCQTGLLKWLITRMLFILTRCTRLLQFQKDSEPIDKKSLRKFKRCLERIPSVDMSWVANRGIAESDPDYALNHSSDAKKQPLGQSNYSKPPEAMCTGLEEAADESDVTTRNNYQTCGQNLLAQESKNGITLKEADNRFAGNLVNVSSFGSLPEEAENFDDYHHDRGPVLDESDSEICRICEEIVPISRLESHSYICAYADKCDLNSVDVDERLSNFAEILEQIIESRNTNGHSSYDSPENSKMQTSSSAATEVYSPRVCEWRNKGVEGMVEEIHEMDIASIDDSLPPSFSLKGHMAMKLCNYGASSSAGSMTSVSSTNTPRAGHFDSFWLEHNNPSELEDTQQMADLANISSCVASTDISKEGAHDVLLAYLQDLQDVLQQSKLKALVIDTFGSRVEKLLREKYILACDLADSRSPKGDGKHLEFSKHLLDCASHSSGASTPRNSSQRERTSIDDFEIIKPISRGAFGKVFLARKRITGDLFAIKAVKKMDMLRKNDVQRIVAERNILITVRNPFVVRFFYSFTCRDNLYLVMEYLNGGDLYSLLRKVGCLEEEVARIYIAELVLALEYLHSMGIVHRDLKPDNILIAHDGHIKLTDFGLSKIGLINSTMDLSGSETKGDISLDVLTPCSQHSENRNQHSAVGTPDYLAPEILLGTEHGYAADWWSVGIILFELITGIPPFNADRPELIFDNILNGKIPWPSVPDDLSYEAQDLIKRLLILDPDRRLGAKGSMEVKAHLFFEGIDWNNLALQKAAFVPSPDTVDDTSYFVSRFSQFSTGIPNDQNSSNSDSESCDSFSDSGDEMDECGDLAEFGSVPVNLSLINFSFKNLSQLASINHDVYVQSGRDSTKCSPSRATDT